MKVGGCATYSKGGKWKPGTNLTSIRTQVRGNTGVFKSKYQRRKNKTGKPRGQRQQDPTSKKQIRGGSSTKEFGGGEKKKEGWEGGENSDNANQKKGWYVI